MNPTWTHPDGSIRLWQGDCRDVLATMPDSSVALIVVDPPYFKVKNEWWDRQWDTSAGFCQWIGTLCDEWQRVLRPNGSLYCFASPAMAWHGYAKSTRSGAR